MSKRKTHEEFLIELYNNCPLYRNGEFKVIGKYSKNFIPIIIKNKYGYLRVTPTEILRKCKQIKTSSAIFKDAYFRELLREKSKAYREGKYQLISEYIGVKEIIYVKNKYGILKSTPADLLSGRLPSILSAVDIDSYVHNLMHEKNEDYRSGTFKIKVGYKSVRDYMILEDKYGEYKVTLHNLLGNMKIWLPSAVNLSANVIKRLEEIHGDRYDYSKISNIKNVNIDKLKIVCKKHGDFEQHYYHHKNGSGCPKCGKESASIILRENPTGWSHSSWIKTAQTSKNFDSFKVYVVKFKDKETGEEFFKIGRTFLTIHLRFNEINRYFDKEEIYIFISEDAKEVIDLEINLLKRNKQFKHIPQRFFHGNNECFSKVEYD